MADNGFDVKNILQLNIQGFLYKVYRDFWNWVWYIYQ